MVIVIEKFEYGKTFMIEDHKKCEELFKVLTNYEKCVEDYREIGKEFTLSDNVGLTFHSKRSESSYLLFFTSEKVTVELFKDDISIIPMDEPLSKLLDIFEVEHINQL